MYLLKDEFRVTEEEANEYNSLPDNLPETKLTQKQKDLVSKLYYNYVGQTIDRMDWSTDLDDLELKEKWPSGPKLKRHEAQRIVLNNIVGLRHKLTNKEAASLFYSALHCRKSWQIVLRNVYKTK